MIQVTLGSLVVSYQVHYENVQVHVDLVGLKSW